MASVGVGQWILKPAKIMDSHSLLRLQLHVREDCLLFRIEAMSEESKS